jgi:nucleoside-diphosphate-sugar epimerase
MGSRKNILITGSSGFIGRALCNQLASLNVITGLDLAENPSFNPSIVWIKFDLDDRNLIKSVCNNCSPDIVIHCAGIARQKIGAVDAAAYMRVNSEATENLAKAAAAVNHDLHFIFLSTISVYGESHAVQPVDEDAVCSPSSDYALSKLDAERRLLRLYEEGLFRRLTILRLAPVYDREWKLNLERRVFAPGKSAYLKFGSGEQKMSALARPNLVELIEHLLNRSSGSRGVEILNVCDMAPYSFKKIIQAFKASGVYPVRPTVTIPLPIVWSATRAAGIVLRGKRAWLHLCYDKLASNLVFDNSKMIQAGFEPRHTLKTIFHQRN